MNFKMKYQIKSGVYAIINIINGKVYIGSSKNIVKRFNSHKRDLKNSTHHNRYLQRAWDKYGEDCFEFEVLEYVEDVIELLEVEQYYMDSTKCYFKEYGYNNSVKAGNCLGVKHTEETRKKMSESSKGMVHTDETKRKIGEGQKNKIIKPVSEETRRKLSEAGKGKKVKEETKIKIGEKQQGSLNHASKIGEIDAKEILFLMMNYNITQKKVGEVFNLTFQTVSSIKRRKIWGHIVLENNFSPRDETIQKINNLGLGKENIKLSESDVINIKKMLQKSIMIKEIAKLFNVTSTCISNIKSGRTWSHVSI